MKTRNSFSIILKGFFLVAAVASVTACQTTSIKPGSEKIRILDAEPKGCLFMGEVSSIQDNDNVVVTNGEAEMSLNTRIEMRNKAFEQNANVLVFTPKNKAKLAAIIPPAADTKKDGKEAAAAPAPAPVAEVSKEKPAQSVFLGTVFRCPPAIFNQ